MAFSWTRTCWVARQDDGDSARVGVAVRALTRSTFEPAPSTLLRVCFVRELLINTSALVSGVQHPYKAGTRPVQTHPESVGAAGVRSADTSALCAVREPMAWRPDRRVKHMQMQMGG